jgi:shikimate dehydrogenase
LITQHTALCGIALHPASHTLSPAMHNAAYAALEVDAVYLAFDVEPAGLAAAVAGWRALRGRLLSVSIPHKQAILEHLDAIDATARRIGAVNTVVRRDDGALEGSNTDWLGAVRALEQETPLAGARAVVLGAGGTARAVAWGLLERGARVRVLNRSEKKARELADALGRGCEAGPLAELRRTPHDVLVNATSVGLREDASPIEAEWIGAGAAVLDAVYDPVRTRLLRDAERRGAKPISGKWMLVHQAAAQIEAWTRLSPPIELMARAFDAASSRA